MRRDVIAGVVIGIMLVPQGMAYALLFLWRGNVVLKGSAAQHVWYKLSTDAATMRQPTSV